MAAGALLSLLLSACHHHRSSLYCTYLRYYTHSHVSAVYLFTLVLYLTVSSRLFLYCFFSTIFSLNFVPLSILDRVIYLSLSARYPSSPSSLRNKPKHPAPYDSRLSLSCSFHHQLPASSLALRLLRSATVAYPEPHPSPARLSINRHRLYGYINI